jgi:hypothetical protein
LKAFLTTEYLDPKSLRLLIDLLKSEAACLRGAGAFGLSLLGPDAKPAIQPLAEALRSDRDIDVARTIVFALGDIGLEAAPALVPGLNHPLAEIREEAHEALATLALAYREGGEEVPELTQAFGEIPELRDLMAPLSEHLGLPPQWVQRLVRRQPGVLIDSLSSLPLPDRFFAEPPSRLCGRTWPCPWSLR